MCLLEGGTTNKNKTPLFILSIIYYNYNFKVHPYSVKISRQHPSAHSSTTLTILAVDTYECQHFHSQSIGQLVSSACRCSLSHCSGQAFAVEPLFSFSFILSISLFSIFIFLKTVYIFVYTLYFITLLLYYTKAISYIIYNIQYTNMYTL